ncbi:MAG: nucleotide pyrophosphatase/phosphodiesterase family protein [Pseudomonadota bacterium]
MSNPMFCFNLVGLCPALLDELIQMPCFSKLIQTGQKAAMQPVFPCLTLPGQATLSTGTYPNEHGIIANGFYYKDRFEISFWDQYRSLVQATPVWEQLKKDRPEFKTATLFCQNTLYGKADFIITPKPLHTDKGLIQWCYSKPVGLYETISQKIGRPFNLMDYWGPFASSKASDWIMEAAACLVRDHQPDFMITYIPHLDYSCQKFGPDSPEVIKDLEILDSLMANFIQTLKTQGIYDQTTLCFFSEYSISNVNKCILLNQTLRDHNFLSVREIEGREYLDFEQSLAFAMVDHQIAHIYVQDKTQIDSLKNLIKQIDGVNHVLGLEEKQSMKIDHERSGDLVAVCDPDKWFAYYWWTDPQKAPDFAFNIDIHRKPGYDPLELFMDMQTFKIPQTPELIKGSHGAPAQNGEGMAVIMLSGQKAGTISLPETMDMIQVAPLLKQLMDSVHV